MTALEAREWYWKLCATPRQCDTVLSDRCDDTGTLAERLAERIESWPADVREPVEELLNAVDELIDAAEAAACDKPRVAASDVAELRDYFWQKTLQ